MVKKIWLTVSNFGIKAGYSSSEERRLKLCNQFIFLSVIFTAVYCFLCAYWALKHALYLELLCLFVYTGLLFNSRANRIRLSRILFVLAINIQMFFLCLCFGRESQIHLVYIPVAAVPLLLFELNPPVKVLGSSFFSLILFILLFAIGFSSPFADGAYARLGPNLEVSCIALSIICEIIIIYSFVVTTNIAERKMDDSNFFLQSQLKAIFDNSQDALFLVDGTNRKIIKANQRAIEIFEAEAEHHFYTLYGNDLHKEKMPLDQLSAFYTELRSTRAFESEILYKTLKGNTFWGALAIRLININDKEYQSVRVTNIDAKKKSQQVTKAALLEKEVLLAEIHHRVKNNMAVISGLLGISSNYVEDEKAKMVFEESRNRIHTMAMIHEKLYSHETLSKIEFKTYIHDLIGHIENSYSKAHTKINFSVACTDIFLDIKSAVPCGLILNELITNSYKHAFAGMSKGEINITCINSSSNFTMHVSDNGIGFDMKELLDKPKTLGLTLISALTEQLSGELNTSAGQGTSYSISFKI